MSPTLVPWLVAALFVLQLLALVWIGGRVGRALRGLEQLSEDLGRVAGRLAAVGRQVDEGWRGVEARVGAIHETFESGRACRVGATIAEVDSKMGHINRKLTDLLERLPRSVSGAEES